MCCGVTAVEFILGYGGYGGISMRGLDGDGGGDVISPELLSTMMLMSMVVKLKVEMKCLEDDGGC